MNDWPADPRLDESLRRLVDTELVAARTDAVGLSRRAVPRRGRGGRALAGLGTLAVIAIVVSLAIRGTGTRGLPAGGSGESESPGASGAVAITSPSVLETASPSPVASEAPSATTTGSFTQTGTMTTSDNGTATLLLDGRVLIVGNGATSPELYDPKTGQFSTTGPAAMDGNFATATRLADGRVLFVGGNNDKTTFASAQIYDPATGKFSPTGSLIAARMGHTATLLADGRVLIAGGSTFNYAAMPMALAMAYHPGSGGRNTSQQKTMTGPDMLASAELYDPNTGKFSATGSMATGHDEASATLLADGRVLIAGGGNEGNAAVASAELYDPQTGKFSPTGSLLVGLYGQSATLLLDGRVLLFGGTDGNQPLNSVQAYDPKTGVFSAAGSAQGSGSLGASALLHDGRVLFVGGFDISAGKSGYLATCEIYDPATGKFSPTASMKTGRLAGSATALLDGRVLVAGGVGAGDPGNLTSAELYQP
jgi:hypothetical protein